MHITRVLRDFRMVCREWDTRTLALVQNHVDLLMIMVATLIAVWSFQSNHAVFVIGMAVTGAMGYFVGLTPACTGGVVFLGLSMLPSAMLEVSRSDALVEVLGYVIAAWVGYRHKQLQRVRRHVQDSRRPHQIVPWVVLNEVRTSLAAIRYLLFPLNDGRQNQELQRATKELSRLEDIFQELEEQNQSSEFPTKRV